MIKVTLEFASAEDAITALGKLRGDVKPETVKDKPAAAAAPKPSAGATDKPKTTEPAAAPAPTVSAPKADAPATPPSESSAPVGYGIIADKIATKAKTHRPEVIALLAKHGAKSGKELKPDSYAVFNTEIDAIGATADADLA